MSSIPVHVIKVCIPSKAFSIYCCLLISSSDKTSSRRSTGASPVMLLIISIDANFIVKIAVLCCPCDPKLLVSIPLIFISKSSLCGPTEVLPFSISFFLFFSNWPRSSSYASNTFFTLVRYWKSISSLWSVISIWIGFPFKLSPFK